MIVLGMTVLGFGVVAVLALGLERLVPRFRSADPFSPAVAYFLLAAMLVWGGFIVGGIALEEGARALPSASAPSKTEGK